MIRPATAVLLAGLLALSIAAPAPAYAENGKNAAAVAGVLLGLALKSAIEENRRKQDEQRWNSGSDRAFRPADLPGVVCYTRAQECYRNNHYSASATRSVFG